MSRALPMRTLRIRKDALRTPCGSLLPTAGSRFIRSIPLNATPRRHAHGVFKGLTESRIVTPWIEALRKKQAEELAPPQPAGDRDMTPKKMSDSYHQVELPLAEDLWLSDTYLNASGRIRLGTLFMDLDALAGIISYKHTGEGVTVVTAAVDRITIEKPPAELCDLTYSGMVTYATGRSSMEITCKVSRARADGQVPKDEDGFLTCTFTMVALDPVTKKAVAIPPLVTTTPHEKHLFSLGESRSVHKKSLAAANLLHKPPNETESALIHAIWLRQLAHHDPNDMHRLPENVRLMAATKLEDTSIMQPQFRNRHQFQVFGGFLMRHAYELAFSCCASFAHARPTFVSLDPSRFLNPVPVGSVLYLTAVVAYTDPPLVSDADAMELYSLSPADSNTKPTNSTPSFPQRTRVQVRVDTKVRDVEHGTSKPTGQFNYTFTVDTDVKVVPQTYQEFMMYIGARRSVQQGDAQAKEEGFTTGGSEFAADRITE